MTRRMLTLLIPLMVLGVFAWPTPTIPNPTIASAAGVPRAFLPLITGSNLTSVRFALKAGTQDVTCGQSYSLGSATTPITITDMRFYVSNIRLLTTQGTEVPFQLREDDWQASDVALLDFENGQNGCVGDARTNTQVLGIVPAGQYNGLRFELGVPFTRNHLDVATASAPLNISALWWNWQGGYKFIRIDLKTPPVITGTQPITITDWFIHLGSTNCPSSGGALPPNSPCGRPNRPTITLNNFNPSTDIVVADLSGLLNGVNLSQNTPAPPGCMSGATDPDCQTMFANLGLDVVSGSCPNGDCSGQKFFRREAILSQNEH